MAVQIDFYQLGRDPVERVVPALAARALESGARVLVVSHDPQQRVALSDALWAREGGFLAHGETGAPHAARQPILLGEALDASNGATIALLADGEWRDGAEAWDRVLLLFAAEQTEAARGLWRQLKGSGYALRFFQQGDGGRWEVRG